MSSSRNYNKFIKIGLFIISIITVISLILLLGYTVVYQNGFALQKDASWWTTLAIIFTLIIAMTGYNLFKDKDLETLSQRIDEVHTEIKKDVKRNYKLSKLSTFLFDITDETNINNKERWEELEQITSELFKEEIINEDLLIRISSIAIKQNAFYEAFVLRNMLYEQFNYSRYRSFMGNALLFSDKALIDNNYADEIKSEESFKKFIIPTKESISTEEYLKYKELHKYKRNVIKELTQDKYRQKQITFGRSVWVRYCQRFNHIQELIDFSNSEMNSFIFTQLYQNYSFFVRSMFLYLYANQNINQEAFKNFIKYENENKSKIKSIVDEDKRIQFKIYKDFRHDILSLYDNKFEGSRLVKNLSKYLAEPSIIHYHKVSSFNIYTTLSNQQDISQLALDLYLVYYWLCGIDDKEAESILEKEDIIDVIDRIKKARRHNMV